MSRSTAERKGKGTRAARPGTLLKHQIPVRTFRRRDDKQPAFREIDALSPDGGYACTLNVADAALCRPEFRALKNKARSWTQQTLDVVRSSFPVPFKGIDSGNGAGFVNRRETRRINFTRGRRHRKNNNAYDAEQKNGDMVRKTTGRGRSPGDNAHSPLARVCAALNPLYTFFYPNLNCIDKPRIGRKTKRVYKQQPQTPFLRIMERPDIPRNIKLRLSGQKAAWILLPSNSLWIRSLIISVG